MKNSFLRIAFLALLLTVAAASVLHPVLPEAQADCELNPFAVCPHVYAPVGCDDGNTYSNQCVADSFCATGCEPVSPFPIGF